MNHALKYSSITEVKHRRLNSKIGPLIRVASSDRQTPSPGFIHLNFKTSMLSPHLHFNKNLFII